LQKKTTKKKFLENQKKKQLKKPVARKKINFKKKVADRKILKILAMPKKIALD